jgi:hypothetical protein
VSGKFVHLSAKFGEVYGKFVRLSAKFGEVYGKLVHLSAKFVHLYENLILLICAIERMKGQSSSIFKYRPASVGSAGQETARSKYGQFP